MSAQVAVRRASWPSDPAAVVDERIGGAGLALTYLGIGLLLVCIVLRGLATSRVPWGNMYEFINLTCFSGLVAAAIVLRRPQFRALWVFVLVPVLILLTVSGRWLYTDAAPVMPALQSYWLPIHVSVVSLGSGVFLVGGVASILFLLKMSPLAEPGPRGRRRPRHRSGCPTRRLWTASRTAPRSSRSRCSASVSSSARSGPRRRGAGTGAGTPRRRWRSSRG